MPKPQTSGIPSPFPRSSNYGSPYMILLYPLTRLTGQLNSAEEQGIHSSGDFLFFLRMPRLPGPPALEKGTGLKDDHFLLRRNALVRQFSRPSHGSQDECLLFQTSLRWVSSGRSRQQASPTEILSLGEEGDRMGRSGHAGLVWGCCSVT